MLDILLNIAMAISAAAGLVMCVSILIDIIGG